VPQPPTCYHRAMTTPDPNPDRPGTGAAFRASLAQDAAHRARSRNLKPLAMLMPYLARQKRDIACAIVFLLASTTATLSLTWAVRHLVDKGLAQADHVNRQFVILVGVGVVLALATACRYYFVTKVGERLVADVRRGVFAHVISLDPGHFATLKVGEVLSRLNTDAVLIESLVGSAASIALRNVLMLVGALAVLLMTNAVLTLLVLLTVPMVVLPLIVYGRRVRRLSVDAQDHLATASGVAGEALEALETVQAFGREDFERTRFDTAITTASAVSLRRITARAVMTALVILLIFGGMSWVLWMGAMQVVAGTMSGGTLAQFVLLSVLAASGFGALAEVWGDVQKAAGAAERITELLAAQPGISAPAVPKRILAPRGEIEFDSVVFAYPHRPDVSALKGLSFKAEAGALTALAGPSGAGKTTVFRLLLRFYDPQRGRITLDGVNIAEMDPRDLRAHFGLVGQDAPLFSGSALENILYARAGLDDATALSAAHAAEVDEFITRFPAGYATTLGEHGKTLSGGQRQRIAIARALARNAPVLLLDEATSALDAENEHLVQKALSTATAGRTTLVIAHRLATVKRADRILMLQDGQLAEAGTHAELMTQGGLYARLAGLQFTS